MKYSIGEFSKITSLSIKSLRIYHEKEILIPTEIDQFTSYRYYNESDVEKAKSIKILKDYDFSLSEIKEMLDSCNDESEILGPVSYTHLSLLISFVTFTFISNLPIG